jgi:hypothetical protein
MYQRVREMSRRNAAEQLALIDKQIEEHMKIKPNDDGDDGSGHLGTSAPAASAQHATSARDSTSVNSKRTVATDSASSTGAPTTNEYDGIDAYPNDNTTNSKGGQSGGSTRQ